MSIDWSRYPKLAAIFEHRPRVNVYWKELDALLLDARREARAEGRLAGLNEHVDLHAPCSLCRTTIRALNQRAEPAAAACKCRNIDRANGDGCGVCQPSPAPTERCETCGEPKDIGPCPRAGTGRKGGRP